MCGYILFIQDTVNVRLNLVALKEAAILGLEFGNLQSFKCMANTAPRCAASKLCYALDQQGQDTDFCMVSILRGSQCCMGHILNWVRLRAL